MYRNKNRAENQYEMLLPITASWKGTKKKMAFLPLSFSEALDFLRRMEGEEDSFAFSERADNFLLLLLLKGGDALLARTMLISTGACLICSGVLAALLS